MGKPQHKAHLHVIDIEPDRPSSHGDDATVTASSVLRDIAYGVPAAILGVSVLAIVGAVFYWTPNTTSLGDGGLQNARWVAYLCLAVAAFAVPVHIAIWLPAKALFAFNYLWRKAEVAVADVALALAVLTLILVAVISASPGIVAQFRKAPVVVSAPPVARAPAKRRPFIAAPAPPLDPVAVVAPYHSRYLRFFQHTRPSSPHKRRKHR